MGPILTLISFANLIILPFILGIYFGHYYGERIWRTSRWIKCKLIRWKRGSNKPKGIILNQ